MTSKSLFRLVCLLALLCSVPSTAAMAELTGRVVGVHDGDTITVLDEMKASYKVRLAEIDAPESKQPYGQKSKQKLSDLVFNKTVTVESKSKDRYGRLIGYVSLNGSDISREMLEQGAAWVYRQYSETDAYLEAEMTAKENKIGIWSLDDKEILPPWEWRKLQKQIRDSKKRKEISNSDERKAGTN